ncbi:MAG TPA: hypothetical protein VHT92_05735 [Candidatus Cybelea sp.]|jgi:hypothetical protein|nr:hypothetical protein [Candidatus Cybelea sp.]
MKYFRTIAASAVLFAFAAPALAQMGQPPPIPMTPAQFAQATPGQSVEISVRVKHVDRSTLYTELLEHQSASVAKATGREVAIFFPDGTPVIMGSASDVTAGALLYVYGVLTKPGHVDAKRVVVDTKYVTVLN